MGYTNYIVQDSRRVVTLDIVDYMKHRVDPSKISVSGFFSCLHYMVASVRSELAGAQIKYNPEYETPRDDILVSIPNIDKQLYEICQLARVNMLKHFQQVEGLDISRLNDVISDEVDTCACTCAFVFLASVGSNIQISLGSIPNGPFEHAADSLKEAHIQTQAKVIYLRDDGVFNISNAKNLICPLDRHAGIEYLGQTSISERANSYTFDCDHRQCNIPLSANDYVVGILWVDFSSNLSNLKMPESVSEICNTLDGRPFLSDQICSTMSEILYDDILEQYLNEATSELHEIKTPSASSQRLLVILYTGFDDLADEWAEHYKENLKRLGLTTLMSRASFKQSLKEKLDEKFNAIVQDASTNQVKILALNAEQDV